MLLNLKKKKCKKISLELVPVIEKKELKWI